MPFHQRLRRMIVFDQVECVALSHSRMLRQYDRPNLAELSGQIASPVHMKADIELAGWATG